MMQLLLLCATIAIGSSAVHVAAGAKKPIDEMAVLSKLPGGQFGMIKDLLSKHAAGVPITGLVRKNRDVQDDPAISILSRGASSSFGTRSMASTSYGDDDEYSTSTSSRGGGSSGKKWLNWKPPTDDLVPAADGSVQNANWKPPAESKDEKAVSGLLGMVAGLTGKSVQTEAQSQGETADQQQPAFANDLQGLGVGQSADPNELRLEAHSMSWDAIVPPTEIFQPARGSPKTSLASSANPKVGKWLGWQPHNDDEEAATYLGDAQQAAPTAAPSQEEIQAQKSLLATSKAVMEANSASSKLGSDLESFDYDTADVHQQQNSYVESLGGAYKMFAGVLPSSSASQGPPAGTQESSSPAQPDVKQMIEAAAGDMHAPSGDGQDQLAALSNMKPDELNVVKSLLAKQQAGASIPGLTPRKHTNLKALFTGSSMESVMDNLSNGGGLSSDSDSGTSDYGSESTSSNYGGPQAIFQGKKNWLNWRPANDDNGVDGHLSYRPTNAKDKDENAVNGLLETVQHLTGKRVQRDQSQQPQQSFQPNFVNDLNPAEAWALREDAKKMSWGEVMQPEMAPPGSALQVQPAPAQPDEFQNDQALRQKAKTESWGDLMRQASPMHQNDRPAMSALQQSSQASYSKYMSDLGMATSGPESSALQEPVSVTSQEKNIENAYLNDLEAPMDRPVAAAQESAPPASPSSSYMNDLQ